MSFLDNALSALSGAGSGSGGLQQLAPILESLLQQHGGLSGLVAQLTRGGLAEQTQSWIGTGPNMPVSGTQVTQALGSDRVTQIAQQMGIDPHQAGSLLAQVLPHVIDHLTPQGQVPAGAAAQSPSSGMLSGVLGALMPKL
jgi:uncharacterized protein YidB (DUF937 family)